MRGYALQVARLDFALLALAATEDGDLFNMLRAGVEELSVASLPVTTVLQLVARWDWDVEERSGRQTVGVVCRDPLNALVHENTYHVDRIDTPAYPLAGRLIAPLPLTFDRTGLYALELTVNRRMLKRMSIMVRQK